MKDKEFGDTRSRSTIKLAAEILTFIRIEFIIPQREKHTTQGETKHQRRLQQLKTKQQEINNINDHDNMNTNNITTEAKIQFTVN